jgi:hypothetical protein
MWRLTFLSETIGWEPAALAFGDANGGLRKEWITLPILRRWVGLWTNWPNVKGKDWIKQRLHPIYDTCDRKLQRELEHEKHEEVTA